MKKYRKIILLKLSLIIFILSGNYKPLNASPVNPILQATTIKVERVSLSYEDYYRSTIFFHGYKKEVRFKNYILTLNHKTAKNLEYSLKFGTGEVYLDGRRTTKYGYEGRLGLSSDIWGDLIVIPLWKWYFGISRGEYRFGDYLNNKIDIKYNFTACNLAILVSKKIGFFVPYSGVLFYYLLDSYKEKTTGLSKSSGISGFSPFMGIKLQLFNNYSAQFESAFNDEKGFSCNMGKLW